MRDPGEDHFDPDQTSTPRIITSGVAANISVPTERFIQGTQEATTYKFWCNPLVDGLTIEIGDEVIDERNFITYTVNSALLRVDADYPDPDDLNDPRSLSHIAGELTRVKGVAR